MFNDKDELIIHINNKEVRVRDLIELLNDIVKIIEDNCNYCKRKGITEDKDKLKLIRNIIKKRAGL